LDPLPSIYPSDLGSSQSSEIGGPPTPPDRNHISHAIARAQEFHKAIQLLHQPNIMNIEFPDQFIRRAARAEIDDSRGGHSETSTSPPRRSSLGQFQLGKLPLPFEKMPSFPITPPTTDADLGPRAETILSTATHVLSTEAAALSCLSQMYATDPLCRNGFVRAVEAIAQSQERGGQNQIIGVGKSGKIGKKLVASMNSLGLVSSFLHPLDATHGDLGQIRKVSYDIPYTSHALFNLSFFFFSFFFFWHLFPRCPLCSASRISLWNSNCMQMPTPRP
jgi:hypothetical protein